MKKMMDEILTALWATFVLSLFAVAIAVCIASMCYGQSPKYTQDELTVMRVKMGELLFFDKNLSADQTISCATCHNPEKGMSDGLRTAVGIGGQVGRRHTPTIYTAAFQPLQFPDGRTLGVDSQSLLPLTNPIEMGNGSVNQVVRRIAPKYNRMSRQLYGKNFDAEVMSYSIAQYEGSQFCSTMPVNRRMDGYEQEFADDPQAEHGYQLFVSKNCMQCHVPPLFTDTAFHNTGISFITQDDDRGRIGVLPQGSDRTADTVRAFKTPTLQGIGASAPYTHRGNVPDLLTMVKAYNAGMVIRNDRGKRVVDRFMDERIVPLGMTDSECEDLAHFLEVGFVSNIKTATPNQ